MLKVLENIISRGDIANIALNEQLILDDEERISVLESMRSIDVQACPGSGKTTLIAAKLILLAKKWPFQHKGICVLSHTNVAKDEIIKRLKRSHTTEAQRLLSYPHFIGTIQEFIGKFIAFPLIRSDGISISQVDTDTCVELIYSKLPRRTRSYIDRRSQHSNVLYDFDLSYLDGVIKVNVPTFTNVSTSQSYKDLLSVRTCLIKDGYFFYRDIFSFARKAISENKAFPSVLWSRFPCVFLDEMQDTQKFQDELLREIFPLDESSLIVQRFGDPDQAIFHGIGSEEPNESFNGKARENMDVVIHKSHRFDNGLADKIKCLSFNEVPLESELELEALTQRAEAHDLGDIFEHTIIVFNDDTRDVVFDRFAQIIANQFEEQYRKTEKFSAKIVGAVGNEIEPSADQLKIGHYWPDYDKTKSKASFKETSLIEAVRYCRLSSSIDWVDNYKLLINCILKLMRMAGREDENDRYFSLSTLKAELIDRSKWGNFRECVFLMLNDDYVLDHQLWQDICRLLIRLLELDDIQVNVSDYLAYQEEVESKDTKNEVVSSESNYLISLVDNKIKCSDGFNIELSTIHGVKGETHDATLILETKNQIFDLEAMLPYLIGNLPSEDHPNVNLVDKPHWRRKFKPNKVFMRQFYVAASRPKHLLCLALHSDRISNEQIDLLQEKGWNIHVLESSS